MKKILAALIMLALLLLNLPKPLENAVNNDGATVTFHFDREVEGSQFKGSTYRLVCENREAARVPDGLVGTEITFEGDLESANALLARLCPVNLVRFEEDGVVVYTGYSFLVSGGVRTKEGIVNFQLAFSGSTVTVGSPLILGSF